MLQSIRDKLTGKIALIILGAIALSFVFVGGASFTTVGSNYVARIDGVDIGINQFEAAYRDQLQSNPQFAALPPDYRKQLRSNILEQLIQQQVIDNYLERVGFKITDKQLIETVQKFPEFHSDGRFDKAKYLLYLEGAAMTPASFEVSIRDNLRRSQLQRAIRGSSVVAPSTYRRYLNLAFENRVITTATILPESVVSKINITEELIADYYEENKTAYFLPEAVDFEYIEIHRDAIAADVNVTEEQLTEYYEINKDRFLQDEQRRSRHILILFDDDESEAETIANEILNRIRSGESFAALAAKHSKDSATSVNGGDLGALTLMQLPEALGGAVFSMQIGETRGLIKGDFGFHIVRLDEILESGPLPYEQLRASLLSELQEEQGEGLYLELKRKVTDKLFDATNIQQLADVFGGSVNKVTDFKRNSTQPFGGNQLAVDAIFDPKLLESQTQSGIAQLSDVIELDIDRTIIISVSKHKKASRDKLENVRDQIVESLTIEQSDSLMAASAQRILDVIKDGEEFTAAAASAGAAVEASWKLARSAKDVDQRLSAVIFTAGKPTDDNPTLGSTRNSVGGYTIYNIEAVNPGKPESIPLGDRDKGRLELVDQTGIDEFIAFAQALREKAEVIVNEDVLAAQGLFQ
jgi:peptidyl-prolyl cis-trans isomerase D